jgi:hypothetical protein
MLHGWLNTIKRIQCLRDREVEDHPDRVEQKQEVAHDPLVVPDKMPITRDQRVLEQVSQIPADSSQVVSRVKSLL